MRGMIGWLAGGVLALAMAGCGDSGSGGTASGPGTGSQPGGPSGTGAMRIGMICAGSTADGGWNQQAKEALEKVQQDLGAQTVIAEQVSEDRAAEGIRDFERRGYELVICHGFEFLAPAQKVAKGQGKTKIAVSGADPGQGYNDILMMEMDISGPAYQLGVLAGKVTKSGKLGFIAGAEIPPVDAAYRAFVSGARSVRPEVSVAKAYTGWEKTVESKQQAEAMLGRGIDVIFQDLDTASKGVFEAVGAYNGRSGQSPAWVFGCNSDQNNNPAAAAHTLASAVIRLDLAFERIAASVKDGSFKPQVMPLNLANGLTVAAINPKAEAVTPEIKAAVEQAGKDLVAGKAKILDKVE